MNITTFHFIRVVPAVSDPVTPVFTVQTQTISTSPVSGGTRAADLV